MSWACEYVSCVGVVAHVCRGLGILVGDLPFDTSAVYGLPMMDELS